MRLGPTKAAVLLAVLPAFVLNGPVYAQRGGRGAPAAAPTPRASAPLQTGDALLELVDRRILAVLVVADRGAGYCCAHRGGWTRDRVGTKINRHGRAQGRGP